MLRKVLVLGLLLFPSCNLPQDPEGTLARVQHGVLRVGLVQDPPWAQVAEGQVVGLEVEMVHHLAEALHARIKWVVGGESKLMEALSDYELDLVIGGLTVESPWCERVGFTQPYFQTRIMIGFPSRVRQLQEVRGQKIAVRTGSLATFLVRRQGGIPVEVDEPQNLNLPVAAEEWQLQAWELESSSLVLQERGHVLAVPPGENGWLCAVERFLAQYRQQLLLFIQQGWDYGKMPTENEKSCRGVDE
jgi:polar amino acid transport system substrate-binding protein